MWVININGTRRKWLRPGRSYTVGRSSKIEDEASTIIVKEPSVSRNHLKISVSAVQPTSSAQPAIKSTITITDLGSRFGSQLDNNALNPNAPKRLPAGCEKALITVGTRCKIKIEWVPVTVTFSTTDTAQMEEIADILEPMDVKLVSDIVPSTTHFMKADKTTTKLVFALSKGIPIVSIEYASALANAANSMELDYSTFPNPLDYLPDSRFAPNRDRRTCLASQTFYIMDRDQFDALEPVIKQAGGKCVLASEATYASDMLIVDPPDDESRTKAQKLGSVVEPSAFLTSIRDCAPVKIAARPRKPQKQVNMLAFMTQSQPVSQLVSQPASQKHPRPPTDSPEPTPKRVRETPKPKQIDMLGFMTQTQSTNTPPAETPPPAAPSQAPSKSTFVEQSLQLGVDADHHDSAELDYEPKRRRKRAAPEPTSPSVPVKRNTRFVDVDHENYENSDESDESESMPGTPELANLVIVENSIAVAEIEDLPDLTPSQWGNVPNFKAFKRAQTIQTASVPLVEAKKCDAEMALSEDESLFVDESQDQASPQEYEEDDEFSFRFS